jgi:hypothetical protein
MNIGARAAPKTINAQTSAHPGPATTSATMPTMNDATEYN